MASKSKRKGSGHYVFKNHDTIGFIDAIEDKAIYLRECFVDLGILDILRNTSRPECVLLGRTGSGKTALLEMLAESEENVIQLNPDNLALNYLSNSSGLKFYEEAGINLSLFYRFLWKHIFVVDIICAYFELNTERNIEAFLSNLRTRTFRNPKIERAREYVLEHAESFWKEREYRVTEETKKLEEDLKKSTGIEFGAELVSVGNASLHLGADTAKQLTLEQKAQIVERGQSVVDQKQIRELNAVFDLLAQELLIDKQKKCFITIDRLDTGWVSDHYRYHLLQALLETIRDINQRLLPVKIVIALREDLFRRIFRLTHLAGDQEEKYVSLCLHIRWKEKDLHECLNLRVNQMIKDKYSGAPVKVQELMPLNIGKKEQTLKYLMDRTLLMPRDMIMFFNECIGQAENRTKINKTHILTAEGIYSSRRLRALRDEWSADYPNLLPISFILRSEKRSFRLADLKRRRVEDFLLNFLIEEADHRDFLYTLVEEKFFNNGQLDETLQEILKVLYRVSIIGIKQESYLTTYWSHLGDEVLPPEIDTRATFHIHPAFWRVFGVQSTSGR